MDDAVLFGIVVVVLVAFSVLISAGLALYSWRRIDHPLSESYGVLMAVDSIWAGGYLLMLLAGGTIIGDFGLIIKATFAAIAGFAWLRFVADYTGDSEWLPAWFWPVGVGQAVLFGLLVGFNPGGLIIEEVIVGQLGYFTVAIETAGIGVFFQLLIGAGLVILSLVLLGRFLFRTQGIYRYQAAIIFGIGTIVLISTVLFVTDNAVHPLVDPTPILFNLQAIAVGWALYRYDFLRLAPVIVTRFFREMSDPVVILDGDQVVADFNEAAAQLLVGLDKQVGIDALDDTFREALSTAINETAAAGEVTAHVDGSDRTYDIEVTRVTDQFDLTQGYVVVLRDITTRKQRERQLEEQNDRLEEFADIVSHDLRNPLATAEGWTTVVADSVADAETELAMAEEGIDHIENAHDRMDELIDVLLTMARQGQTVADPEPVELATVAREAWGIVDTGEMTLAIDTDQTVAADSVRLQQAFENLFRNTADHAEATTVRLTALPEGFAIDDDGMGVPEADREELFEFGYTTDEEGTGIGLAVVKRIVEAHGWQIAVSDSELGGVRFEITGVVEAEE